MVQQRVKRLQPPGDAAHPRGQCLPVERDALGGKHLFLAIQRQLVAVFHHRDVGQQGFRHHSTVDRLGRRGCLYHTLAAAPAAVPRTHDALDPVLHRNDVEGFLDGLPDLVQLLAAAGAAVALDIDHDIDARQMLRKLPAVASRRSLSTALRSVRQPASGHIVVGSGTSRLCADGEERQLSDIQCLGARTEDHALVLGQDHQELVVLLDRSVAVSDRCITLGRQCAAFLRQRRKP
ncbi:hypothetical protein AB7M56_000377 [Bradyrhizobium elkanii]